MNRIPKHGYLRLRQIIGNKKVYPAITPIVPVSAASWWRGVKNGKYPQPVKLTMRTTVWRGLEIWALVKYGPRWKEMLQNETEEGE